MRSVWFVTPGSPGSQPLENSYDVQPDNEAIRTANSGTMAHLFLRFGSKIDPSISFRYKSSLWVIPSQNRHNTPKLKGINDF